MNNGRFGPIEPNEQPKKKYRVDYNRLITVVMIAVIAVLVWVIFKDSRKEPTPVDEPVFIEMPTNRFAVTTPAPRATVSPEEIRPVSENENLLPVFYDAKTTSMRVAVTIEQMSNGDNIAKALEFLGTYNAKVTFFPTGQELLKNEKIWPQVVVAGHQIENHTYSNKPLSGLMDEDKTEEVREHTNILRSIVGATYQPHFLRTDSLEDDKDEFLHGFLKGSGYYGIARYAPVSSFEDVTPGLILNFPLTNDGLNKLKSAVKVLAANGYEMVTLNELFMYPDNLEDSEG